MTDPETCPHCGRPRTGLGSIASGERVCHPDDPELPDCYRRVTVWEEPFGALRSEEGDLPAGVEDIRVTAEFEAAVETVMVDEQAAGIFPA